MTRRKAAGVAGGAVLVFVISGGTWLGLQHPGQASASPRQAPRPTTVQVDELARLATSGNAASLASAFEGLPAASVSSALAQQLHEVVNLHVKGGSIRGEGNHVASATLVGTAGGKPVTDRVVMTLDHGRWLLVTGTR